jgi:hypothetical protein
VISSTGTETDGYVGMSTTLPLDFAQPTAAGYYDAVGAMEHEISEVMGRVGAVGPRTERAFIRRSISSATARRVFARRP